MDYQKIDAALAGALADAIDDEEPAAFVVFIETTGALSEGEQRMLHEFGAPATMPPDW